MHKNNSQTSTIYKLRCSLLPSDGPQLISASGAELGCKTNRSAQQILNNTIPEQ